MTDQPRDRPTEAAEPSETTGVVGPSDAAEPAEVVRRVPRPKLRSVGLWLLLVGGAIALDGVVGGLTLVLVAAVLIAGINPRVLGALGVVALLGAPVAVLLRGLPGADEISPLFVVGSLVPHHLTFAGLTLVSAFALIDLAPHLETWATTPRAPQDDGPPLGALLSTAVAIVVALAALWACAAVLQA